jgi:hypothetical protein
MNEELRQLRIENKLLREENERLKKEITNQDAILERQTARIVELQEHIENFDGEDNMTRDEIVSMAKEAGLLGGPVFTQGLEHFAKLVRNDYSNKHAQLWLKRIDEAIQTEREACAKVCDDWPNGRDDVYEIGVAIRARGQE